MWINASVSGVYVGSREDFMAMNAFISEHEIRPLIDRVFEFENAPEAFEYMASGDFMGKIVIRHRIPQVLPARRRSSYPAMA
jgi:D-arabinose 1-dehydrogenase-like Zn-dependent alcohol dehydrogenase